ncbi:hypothetical protein U1Q18_050146 [Sarracenia purpurea var. burkii]
MRFLVIGFIYSYLYNTRIYEAMTTTKTTGTEWEMEKVAKVVITFVDAGLVKKLQDAGQRRIVVESS